MKMVNYKELSPSNITSPEFRHLLLLLYWPFYGLAFLTLERFLKLNYTAVHCRLDDLIPFCEFFVVPYYLWFGFIAWIMLYTVLYDIPAFKKFHYFVIITYTVTCVIYILFPNKQELRPDEFARDNIFVDIAKGLYAFDTNTNVCPSLHVIGSMAALFTAWHSKRYCTARWRAAFIVMTVIICAATLFLRQHSVIDVAAGLVISFAAEPIVWHKKRMSAAQTTEEQKETVYK